jgi:uncharacterized protein (DUF342 family)
MPIQELHYQNEMPTKTAQNLHNQIELNACSIRHIMSIKTEMKTASQHQLKSKLKWLQEKYHEHENSNNSLKSNIRNDSNWNNYSDSALTAATKILLCNWVFLCTE